MYYQPMLKHGITTQQATTGAKYKDAAALYEGLRHTHTDAIQYLQQRITPVLAQQALQYHLAPLDLEELLIDTVMITLQKIANADYAYKGYSPVTYSIEIGKRVLMNYVRKRKTHTQDIDTVQHLGEDSLNDFFVQKEKIAALENLLTKVGSNCERLIRLKYYDNYKDDEIVQLQLTQYTTTDTVKSKRSDCMKKLTQLAKQYSTHFFDYL